MKRSLHVAARFPEIVAYMLQSTEYNSLDYIKWLWRTRDFSTVMNRRVLDITTIARLVVLFLRIGIALQLMVGLYLIVLGGMGAGIRFVMVGGALFILAPSLWAHLVLLPTFFARKFIIEPRRKLQQQETRKILGQHTGTVIAVAGSYGKTTMKEILVTILAQGKKVAATPANKNVAIAHFNFAQQLDGDEDVLIIEFGESQPGDVATFTENTQPDLGVITGIAPAHLDGYGSVEEVAKDVFSLAEFLEDESVYVNQESLLTHPFLKPGYITYDQEGVGTWKITNIKMAISGTSFTLKSPEQTLRIHSPLLGAHLVGVLSAAIVISLKLGLTIKQVETGIAHIVPYQHRMQPYQLAGGWVVDDSYNGNLEGIRAGTKLLAALPAKRKMYVTPGLVDQGSETESVHYEVGQLIAHARPDVVIVMKNSVTNYILQGLREAKYDGEIKIEDQPLTFYTHLDQIMADGDIVMLQNDWTDNYS